MIRKDGTVSVKQIYKIRVLVLESTKKDPNKQVMFMETIVIADLGCAINTYQRYLKQVQYDIQFNGNKKKARCELFVPHIHADGELAYWPENGKYIKQFLYNMES